MAREEKAKKRHRRKKIRFILGVIMIISFILGTITMFYKMNVKTFVVKKGFIEVTEKVEGVIVKDEKVYKSDCHGEIEFFEDEGEKISIGTKIAEISINKNDLILKNELIEIENKLDKFQNAQAHEKTSVQTAIEKRKYIDNIVLGIQKNIIKGKYTEIFRLKNELDININENKNIISKNDYDDYDLEKLIEQKEKLMNEIESLSRSYYSDFTGILSYNIDGLETIYSSEKVSEFTPENFRIIGGEVNSVIDKTEVNFGESIFKICNNYKWYLITKINHKSLEQLEEGDTVYIKLNEIEDRFKAKIFRINTEGEQSLIVFSFDEYFYKIANDRYVDVEIIKKRYDGFKIPKDIIVEKDEHKGVYIKDISNIVKFRYIEIKVEDDEYVIISEGDSGKIEVEIDGQMKNKYTVQMYDKIIVDVKKIEEGDIIN